MQKVGQLGLNADVRCISSKDESISAVKRNELESKEKMTVALDSLLCDSLLLTN